MKNDNNNNEYKIHSQFSVTQIIHSLAQLDGVDIQKQTIFNGDFISFLLDSNSSKTQKQQVPVKSQQRCLIDAYFAIYDLF